MKYYLIAGEASGDLHASHLMAALKNLDSEAKFMYIGGDKMAAEGGIMANHYRNLAYMGFIPVLLHSFTILMNMRLCKKDIAAWQPDVVILIDYPGFNLNIAKYVKAKLGIPVYYYISPKIWAWKEYRIKNIKRDVDELFSILPFEISFFEQKHGYKINYVGNPTADEVAEFEGTYSESLSDFSTKNNIDNAKPIIALLAGSRKQEIKDNLPAMIEATKSLADRYNIVLAGAPSIPSDYYAPLVNGSHIKIVYDQTYPLLHHSEAALVTSGTATLETALFGVPQVVCYETPIPKVIAFLRRHLLKVKYISLVNLIADEEVVPELVADTFSVDNIHGHLSDILVGGSKRDTMLNGYKKVVAALGKKGAPMNAAKIMVEKLNVKQS